MILFSLLCNLFLHFIIYTFSTFSSVFPFSPIFTPLFFLVYFSDFFNLFLFSPVFSSFLNFDLFLSIFLSFFRPFSSPSSSVFLTFFFLLFPLSVSVYPSLPSLLHRRQINELFLPDTHCYFFSLVPCSPFSCPSSSYVFPSRFVSFSFPLLYSILISFLLCKYIS